MRGAVVCFKKYDVWQKHGKRREYGNAENMETLVAWLAGVLLHVEKPLLVRIENPNFRQCKAGDDKLNPSSSFKFVATLFYSSIKNIPQIFFLQIFRLSSFTVHLFSLAD
ncbi:hypothetical protein L2E82_19488 [Cichorium intybus]|uniref:Uncharacterized protein n=1 Tax=Cichorium intybus TaxID=13427 RepID=A0ACB9FCL0_CICIN|nr:hypothetical protein L2E82_19488 [Cichorium intybus]